MCNKSGQDFVDIDLKEGVDSTPSPPPPNLARRDRRRSTWFQDLIVKKTEGLTRRQILIGVVFALVEFFAATVISIQAPFFPHVAATKGATSVEYGFVFGIFELTVFIMSPFFGAKMGAYGPRRLFIYGIFTTGLCCTLFGFLDFIDDRVTFIVSCFVVRTLEAVGDAAFVVASFTIIAMEFPSSVATTFGTMETFYGLGMIAGPTLGGALYDIGGYTFPFVTMGGLLFISAIGSSFLLPPPKSDDNSKLVTASGLEIFRLLRHPSIFIVAYSVVATAAGVGFLHSTLEQHLVGVDASLGKLHIGGIFILNGGVYALTAPTWGKLCDKAKQPKYFTLVGSLFTISGFILLAPLLPIETALWSICSGLVLFGLGLGSILVSAFIQVMQDAVAAGYPDDVATYGLVSGLWTSMVALGFFLGASSGGVLDFWIGFRWGTTFIVGAQLILVILVVLLFCVKGSTRQDMNPSEDNSSSGSSSLSSPSKAQQGQISIKRDSNWNL